MDRIRKALDLARADRARLIQEETPQARAAESKPAAPRAGTPAVIEYTQTQVYKPRPGLLEANRIVNPLRSEPAAAAFRMLRTQVLQRMDEKGFRLMAMLSAHANEGKTTTAINLAISLAHDQRHTVLLVDCDLRNPAIAATMGIEAPLGINDVLSGQATVEQCLYHPDGFDRLVILPASGALAQSSEALSGPRARQVVAELRERYPERVILFDLPPVMGADDALAFLPMVDCALMVVAEKSTHREDLLRCMELVRNTPIVGTVLNRSTSVTSAYR
jgi:Mrp family chromosome partitioning ATPase